MIRGLRTGSAIIWGIMIWASEFGHLVLGSHDLEVSEVRGCPGLGSQLMSQNLDMRTHGCILNWGFQGLWVSGFGGMGPRGCQTLGGLCRSEDGACGQTLPSRWPASSLAVGEGERRQVGRHPASGEGGIWGQERGTGVANSPRRPPPPRVPF